MASKIPQKEERLRTEDSETPPDRPLLDDAAVKALIRAAKRRGYVTHDQINAMLASDEVNSEQIENILAMFSETGINVVETKETRVEEEVAAPEESDDDEEDGTEGKNEVLEIQQRSAPAKSGGKEPAERTDDPVRMYLREMGSVELLSREGEIAIAKRIEAGREAMIAGLCESPLTFQAIIVWRDELNEGKALLRDIIDLDATYAGPEAKQMQGPAQPDSPQEAAAADDGMMAPPEKGDGADAPAAPGAPDGRPEGEVAEDDEDDLENALSLAAMEAELKPKVVELFDKVADNYKRLRRLQDQNVEFKLKNESLSPSQERR